MELEFHPISEVLGQNFVVTQSSRREAELKPAPRGRWLTTQVAVWRKYLVIQNNDDHPPNTASYSAFRANQPFDNTWKWHHGISFLTAESPLTSLSWVAEKEKKTITLVLKMRSYEEHVLEEASKKFLWRRIYPRYSGEHLTSKQGTVPCSFHRRSR